MLLLVLALALVPGTARAQSIRGLVLEDGTDAPVEGAMVLLLELDGQTVHRVLTNPSGSFVLRAAHPGRYTLRVDRIGYESLVTDAFDVPVDGTFQRVTVPIRPVELVGLDVEASRRCELRGQQGAATSRAWEEARKALAAAQWTLESGAYRYTLLNYTRRLDDQARRTLNEDRRFVRSTRQAPYASAPPDLLAEGGFVQEDRGSFVYYAPDATALLSDVFLDTHCMRLESVAHGEVGLAFEPVRGRRVSDIEGTLWLDAESAQLRRLEFTYVNLPPDRDAGVASGEVVFGGLPNGTWIVRDWHIRMPQLASDPRQTRVVVAGYSEQGGTVWRVATPDGATVVEAESSSIVGTVVDSLGTQPLANARVGIAEDTTVLTGDDGRFSLTGLAEGLQIIQVTHPSLDSLGLGATTHVVTTETGTVESATLRVPGVREVLLQACEGTPESERETSILLGRVRRNGAPAAGASVRIRWLGQSRRGFMASGRAAPALGGSEGPTWSEDQERADWLVATLDQRGIFMVCGIPTRTEMRVEAGDPDAPEARTVALPQGTPVVVVTLTLPPAPS